MDPDVLLLAVLEILETTQDPDERQRAIEHLIEQKGESE